jgi:hypothetical protein
MTGHKKGNIPSEHRMNMTFLTKLGNKPKEISETLKQMYRETVLSKACVS